MFTVEMELDEVAITVLDDSGQYEDMQVFIYDDIVYIKQWDEEVLRYRTIAVTPQMFKELTLAMNRPEGAYTYRIKQY